MRPPRVRSFVLACVVASSATAARAQVVRLEITPREPMKDAAAPAPAIPSELPRGKVHGEIDPNDPHNTIIQDLDLAPTPEGGIRGDVRPGETAGHVPGGAGADRTLSGLFRNYRSRPRALLRCRRWCDDGAVSVSPRWVPRSRIPPPVSSSGTHGSHGIHGRPTPARRTPRGPSHAATGRSPIASRCPGLVHPTQPGSA